MQFLAISLKQCWTKYMCLYMYTKAFEIFIRCSDVKQSLIKFYKWNNNSFIYVKVYEFIKIASIDEVSQIGVPLWERQSVRWETNNKCTWLGAKLYFCLEHDANTTSGCQEVATCQPTHSLVLMALTPKGEKYKIYKQLIYEGAWMTMKATCLLSSTPPLVHTILGGILTNEPIIHHYSGNV